MSAPDGPPTVSSTAGRLRSPTTDLRSGQLLGDPLGHLNGQLRDEALLLQRHCPQFLGQEIGEAQGMVADSRLIPAVGIIDRRLPPG
jgi:hypothetical protein